MNLREAILSFMESHQKVEMRVLPDYFKKSTPEQVKRAVDKLVEDGWLKVNDNYTNNGDRINSAIVYRTSKQRFEQQKLFDLS
jgi:hypothetical protein